MQRRQLARIPPVGLYPIPRPRRHQPGRDNLAIDARTDQMAIKPEPRRARLIDRPRPRPRAQLALNPLVVKGNESSRTTSPARTAARRTEDLCTSNPTATALASPTVGDLRMWLGREPPATHANAQAAGHPHRAPGPPGRSILSS